jgi:hypothetical protein
MEPRCSVASASGTSTRRTIRRRCCPVEVQPRQLPDALTAASNTARPTSSGSNPGALIAAESPAAMANEPGLRSEAFEVDDLQAIIERLRPGRRHRRVRARLATVATADDVCPSAAHGRFGAVGCTTSGAHHVLAPSPPPATRRPLPLLSSRRGDDAAGGPSASSYADLWHDHRQRGPASPWPRRAPNRARARSPAAVVGRQVQPTRRSQGRAPRTMQPKERGAGDQNR